MDVLQVPILFLTIAVETTHSNPVFQIEFWKLELIQKSYSRR